MFEGLERHPGATLPIVNQIDDAHPSGTEARDDAELFGPSKIGRQQLRRSTHAPILTSTSRDADAALMTT